MFDSSRGSVVRTRQCAPDIPDMPDISDDSTEDMEDISDWSAIPGKKSKIS